MIFASIQKRKYIIHHTASKYQSTKQHVFDNYTNVVQTDKHILSNTSKITQKHKFWVLWTVVRITGINTQTAQIKFRYVELVSKSVIGYFSYG